MSTPIDQKLTAKIAEDVFREKKLPGLLVAIAEKGSLIQVHKLGLSDVEKGLPLAENQLFPLGSLTKSFAAAAILILRNYGLLTLNQSPAEIIPELRSSTFFKDISLFQLLSMQSGLGEDSGGSWAEQHLRLTNAELSTVFAAGVVAGASQSREYFYSNFGYMILGRVISAVSCLDARDFITEQFLKPLKLTSTTWEIPKNKFVIGYNSNASKYVKELFYPANNDGAVFGGLWSSLSDMAKWIDFFNDVHCLNSSQYDHILSRASRLEMQRAVSLCRLEPSEDNIRGYGLGLVNYPNINEWAVGHSGAVPGFGCTMRWSPRSQLGVFAVANLRYADLSDCCKQILGIITQDVSLPKPVLHPLVAQRGTELLSLVYNWQDEVANNLFAINYFIDNQRKGVFQRFAALNKQFGKSLDSAQIVQGPGLTAKILISGKEILSLTLSPVQPGLIQDIVFED